MSFSHYILYLKVIYAFHVISWIRNEIYNDVKYANNNVSVSFDYQ